jgi:hypothetical protein
LNYTLSGGKQKEPSAKTDIVLLAFLSENKTLVITCKLTFEEVGESTFHFHYRYYNKELYCFIEEAQSK